MDPQACFENWKDAILNEDWDCAYQHQDAYNNWVKGGGVKAEDTRSCLSIYSLDTETETYVADGTRRQVR